jgi:hypothetical protein
VFGSEDILGNLCKTEVVTYRHVLTS